MKESGVCHQSGNGKWRNEMSVSKQVVKFVLILVVCFWLLYQVHEIHTRNCECDEIDSELRNKRIGRLLGRKGGLKTFNDSKANEKRVNVEVTPWRNFGEFSIKEGESKEKLQEIKEKNVGENKSEEETLINVGAVILKNAESKLEVSRVGDDGVSRHDSGPSRRTNMEINSSGNVGNEMDKCQKLCSKKMAKKRNSVKSERKGVDEGGKVAVFESGQAGMRELLNIAKNRQ